MDEPGVFHLREETGRNEKVYPLGKRTVPSETADEISVHMLKALGDKTIASVYTKSNQRVSMANSWINYFRNES